MYITINEATYAYEVVGSGSPILLLHGFTGTRSTWEAFVEAWSDKFQIITLDLPGHGETTIPSPRTMEEFCHDLAQFCAQLELTSLHLVGYSMGGRTALSFAMQYPSLIRSLTLASASPGLRSNQERLTRQEQDEMLAKKLETEGIEQFVNYWENLPLFATQQRLPHHVQKAIRQERLSQSPTGLAASLRGMGTGMQPSWWDHLGELVCPTLLIVGSLDHKFVKLNKQMEKHIKQGQLNIIDGVGHAVHIEQPTTFNQIVGHFIQSNEKLYRISD